MFLYASSWVRAIPSFRFSPRKLHKVLTQKCFIQKMFKVIKHDLHLDFTKTVKGESWCVFRRRNHNSTSFSENVPLQLRVSQWPLWSFAHPPGVSWLLVFCVLPSAWVGSVCSQCCWSDSDLLSVQNWAGWPCSLGNCSLLFSVFVEGCGVGFYVIHYQCGCTATPFSPNKTSFASLGYVLLRFTHCVLCVCGLSDGPPSSRGQVVS